MTAVTQRPRARATAASTTSWFPGWRLLGTPLLAWLLSRVVVVAAIAFGSWVRGDGQGVVAALHLWDGNWYLDAAAGYELPNAAAADVGKSDIAFFPLYPLLVRALAGFSGASLLTSSIIVAVVAGTLAIVAIWLLIHRIADRDTADRTAWLVAFFPASVVLTMVYSEGVMLAAAAACLLALHERRWVIAGVLGALATASRPNGVAVVAACAVAALLAITARREWRAVAAPAIGSLGIALYLGWLWLRTGSPVIWFRVQREGWGEVVDLGAATGRLVTTWIPRLAVTEPGQWPPVVSLRLFGLAVLVAGLVALWRWRPPITLTVYSLAVVALPLISKTLGPRPRFIFVAFPLIAAIAWAARGRWHWALLAGSGALLALTSALYTTRGLVVP